MENILIRDSNSLDIKIKKIGVENLHVISDFDRTLTTAFVDGKGIPSLISVLRDGNYLGSEYSEEAKALFNKYHPIEVSPEISLDKKKKAMHEWWMDHFRLLIKSGLNKKNLRRMVESGKVKFRQGSLEFIDFLHEKNIPLVIMSSSGLGGDGISMYLEKEKRLYDNVHIISNSFKWDDNGNAVDIKKPIIHVLSKDETVIKDFPFFNKIKNRKNVLLLGDGLGDIGMVGGFKYKEIIKVGFLNDNINKMKEGYLRNFDVVILNDGSMEYVNSLIRKIYK